MSSETPVPGRAPVSTYRFQFNRHFTFADAAALIPYLDELGISDVYASPYLQARAGSMHGYDISNHNRLNPEIGTEEEHAALTRAILERGMGHLLDIVPNHMGIGQPDNEWWLDVLEHGPASPYAPFFDIDWEPLKPELAGKVLLPVLGDQFGRVLENQELELRYEGERFWIHYYEAKFPVSPRSMALVLRQALHVLSETRGADDPDHVELESIVTALEHLPPRDRTDAESVRERRREALVSRRRIAALHSASDGFRNALEQAVRLFNGEEGDPHSFDLLERLLDDQPYRLAFWRVAAEEINYRRFFDINDLAGVRVERPEVFAETHRLILRLVQEGKVTGLRIDHPDGLYDPRSYLRQLQDESSRRTPTPPMYVAVEKILTGEEELPADWPVAGTVGYEYMSRLNALFVDRRGEEGLNEAYERFLGHSIHFRDLVYQKKRLILRSSLASELNVLANLLSRLSESDRRSRDFTLGSLLDALRETIACFPIYRTYIDAHTGRVAVRDREYVDQAIRAAIRRNRSTSSSIFEFIRNTLLLRWPDSLDEDTRREHARFVMKFQQLTGPVMAKGVEDTSFYIYNRLISLNEVGGEPDVCGIPAEEFHRWVAARQKTWPTAMNSTSTHDTKRSEDVRARIHVISEIPGEWAEHALRWAEANQAHRREEEGERIPERNDEYLLYQTLLGAWPLGEADEEDRARFVERVQQYMEKATREAKAHTSWINPNAAYDEGLKQFIARILDPGNRAFLDDFVPFQRRVARVGMLNALGQTLVKLTSPGVPDVYQGQEVWDFSMVDPDNRRPVDYEARHALLRGLAASLEGRPLPEVARELVESWEDGRAKLFLTSTVLRLRRADPELLVTGEYLPLRASGERAEHVVAFARRSGERRLLVVVPRLCAGLIEEEGAPRFREGVWSGTAVEGDAELLEGRWRDLLGGGEAQGEAGSIPLQGLFGSFPVALLERVDSRK